MRPDLILANARLILKDSVIFGALCLQDGKIVEIEQGTSIPAGAIDCEKDFIAPGLVELHTDNLERHLSPRPETNWPHRAAILAHDRELAATGITTVFDAVRVGSIVSDRRKRLMKYAREIATEISDMHRAGALKISHRLHLRAEICSETLIAELEEFSAEDRIGIVSMMDHTPGQRQFSDEAKFESYICAKHDLDKRDFSDYITFLKGLQEEHATEHEAAAVAAAQRFGARLASHDDTTAAQVALSHRHGVTLAEFPTTLEAAEACHGLGIATIMGAPNIVRGSSHSGNVAALELAQHDWLDILSSDYVPAGLLMAALILGELWDDLPRGLATVTANPARSAGLDDRGQIDLDQRADLIRFARVDGDTVLKETWVQGRRVA
ncbi:alpha-D-ribose 1-methylphosphonate 5-triphosphate diphosphatase [Sulfitobacter sp. F26204]|uniref:alpha-D-ribose 1-methylphosphonate 5-triphosphate diphosphatase n=1 Tax=Sulfitobacter sp. F26204 TaxID=2996014 RepID=UPI00225E53EB|nr:alpha-D-ribose 1-methylphosphonate 5-triphosphate diphosphatase [Sulfitobacter sp. F26204]MCX7559042.1 alpha-D-ribose 1-methylphosphonate 5-triphosphate diphosphatase [Sulfitobacter sp. F26204]